MLVNELRQRLSELDSTIFRHESIIEELKQQRADVVSQLEEVVYPVLTLPSEITIEIFKWCYEGGMRVLPSVPPLLFTRICHDWRELALSTPALWDTLDDFEFSDPLEDGEFVSTWFSRASTHPLSLGIIYPEHLLESADLEAVFRRHGSQLRRLNVMTQPDILLDFDTIPSFPLLSELSLVCCPEEDNEFQINVFRDAPSLRHLSIESFPPSVLSLPWAQLTKATLSFISLTECLGFLRLATSLVEFRRDALPEKDEKKESIFGKSPVSHPSLTTVSVTTLSGEEGILRLLTLPGLQKLELQGRWSVATHMDGWSVANKMDGVLVPFLTRTCATLRALTIPMSTSPPVDWFQLLTHLTTLELVQPPGRLSFPKDAIWVLHRRKWPALLPKLHTLVISECGSNRVDTKLLEVLGSRCDVSKAKRARLESFSIIWPEYETPDDGAVRLPLVNVAPLRALAARGMRIHIGTREQNSFY
ncbi:hypothetical protein K438DRAFT_1796355 [Mycena galopus ATCC 62051]|nr:hypothetical protein K438DRAFT_1796355 [Mycena galopus ATCC 62051]